MKQILSFVLAFVLALGSITVVLWQLLGPLSSSTTEIVFVVPQAACGFRRAACALYAASYPKRNSLQMVYDNYGAGQKCRARRI